MRLLILALGTAVAAAAADPLAVVVKVEGRVEVVRGEAARPAQVGMTLEQGDRVVPASGASAVLLHSSGRTEIAARPLTIQATAQAERAGLFTRAVRTLDNVAAASAKTDPNRQGMIRPIPGTPAPVAPRNGIVVAADRPTFVWFAISGATGYTIQLRADGGRPVRYQTGADTVWTLPADAPALAPGSTVQWTVAPHGSARVAPPQSFRVATADERAAVEAALAQLRATGLDPSGDGAFLAALIYHDAGFAYEADRLLAEIEAAGGEQGRAFHLLRAEVHDALGRLDAAAAAFAHADALTGR